MKLYDIVTEYSDLGYHRTGTRVEENTLTWLSNSVEGLGGTCTFHSYQLPVYHHQVSIGPNIECLPLYYSAVGQYSGSNYYLERLTFDDQHENDCINAQIKAACHKARTFGKDILVLATGDNKSGLCAINRSPADSLNFPVVLVAGKDHDQLSKGRFEVEFQARLENSYSRNLIAYFGNTTSNITPLMITTPISGWFNCAGERGTGIAIALSVAANIGKNHPVMLLCPTAHELGYLGAEIFARQYTSNTKAILHIGSCVAVRPEPKALIEARSNFGKQPYEECAHLLKDSDIQLLRPEKPYEKTEWFGESECWASTGLPMISIAGASANFHTKDDLPHSATTPAILEQKERLFCQIAKSALG